MIEGTPVRMSNGIAWYGDSITPPALPEWSDPDFKTFEYTREITSDPSVMLENLLDHEHVDAVHAFSLKRGTSPRIVKIFGDPRTNHGYALYDYGGGFLLENEFWLPWTNVLRFKLKNNVLCLWSSLTPLETPNNNTLAMHFRVSRNGDYKWVPNCVLAWINDFVLSEDRRIVKDIDGDFVGTLSDPADSFVSLYREMKKKYDPMAR